jgi:DNA (cytosine-5)-methyltransferase 1
MSKDIKDRKGIDKTESRFLGTANFEIRNSGKYCDMKHGSLFSGIGGFDLAAQWMGWENVFHCEWNPFGQKVLHHYWPNAEQFTDITKTDFTKYANKIDVLSGGFPCQPYSVAGKQKGKDDERHLWPEMRRAIMEISPRFIVGENVRGLTNWNGGLVFDEVCAQMEDIGYKVAPFLIPASGVGAPHRRERIWFVAYADMYGSKQRNGNNEVNASKSGFNAFSNTNKSNGNGDVADTGDKGLERGKIGGGIEGIGKESHEFIARCIRPNWQKFPTESPVCFGNDGISPELDGITFSKWRNESIKAGGNAIVPQVAFQIFKAIEQYQLLKAPAPYIRQ